MSDHNVILASSFLPNKMIKKKDNENVIKLWQNFFIQNRLIFFKKSIWLPNVIRNQNNSLDIDDIHSIDTENN